MKIRKTIIYIFSQLLLLSNGLTAQQLSIDSLFNIINHSKTFEQKYDATTQVFYQINKYNRQKTLLDSVKKIIQQLSVVAESKKDTSHFAYLLLLKGKCFYVLIEYDSCVSYIDSALYLFPIKKDTYGVAECYYYLCFINYSTDHFNTAVNYFFKALEIYEQQKDTGLLSEMYFNLGMMYHDDEREPEKAIKHFSKNFSSVNELDPVHYCFISDEYIQLKKADSAAYYLKKGKLVLKNSYPYQLPYYFRALANYYKYIGKLDSASFYFLKTIRGLEIVRQQFNTAKCYYQLGEIAFLKNDLDAAEKYYYRAESYAKKYQRYSELSKAYLGLNRIYEKQHNIEKAYLKLKQYRQVEDSLKKLEATDILLSQDLQHTFSLQEMQMKQEQLKKDNQIKLLSIENKLKQATTEKENLRKKFAYAGIVAIIVLGAYGFYLYSRRKRLQSRQALMNERLRISRELHDEVGATLSSISIFSQAAIQKNESGNMADSKTILKRIGETSREVMGELNDAVWLINPHNDNLQKIIQRISNYALPLCRTNNIRFEIKAASSVENIDLSVDKRKAIYLIIKEAVNNSLKYAAAKNLILQFEKNHKALHISIKDDGRGFSENNLSAGNGLNNMKQRAKDVNGKIDFDSVQQKGTEIILEVPLTNIGD